MDSTKRAEAFLKTQTTLKEVRTKLVELSQSNLADIHVSHEWSWIPYVKDHIDFLIEQIGGIERALKDAPPPVTPEDIARLTSKDKT
jgi:hypothetical protein